MSQVYKILSFQPLKVLTVVLAVFAGLGQSHKNNTSNDFSCLKSYTQVSDAELSCKSETLAALENQLSTFVHLTSHRGDAFNNLKLTLRETHLNMKENYAKLIYSVGRNIFPLIVASDCDSPDLCGVGSTFKLYLKDGSMKRTTKVPDEFEIYKFLSHMVLGVFAIVSPYFKSGHSTSWIPPLREFQHKIHSSINAIPTAANRISSSDSQVAFQMLKIVNDYTQNAIAVEKVDEASYSAFAKKLVPHMEICMRNAARLQTEHILPQLRQWKKELGAQWKNAYAVIPAIWGVSGSNVRLLMLEQVMDFEQVRQQVLIVEGTQDQAITTLGRIVSDRAVAQLVFGGIDDENAQDHAFSLSTRRDILSTHAAAAMREQCQKTSKTGTKCPMTKIFATMVQ